MLSTASTRGRRLLFLRFDSFATSDAASTHTSLRIAYEGSEDTKGGQSDEDD